MRDPRSQSRQSIERARQLRQVSTQGEQIVWWIVRNRSLGVKFRRQHPIGPYVLDFYCPQLRFAIELDGAAHDSESVKRHDTNREFRLQHHGITILRIRTEQVVANPRLVKAQIEREIADLQLLPPSPSGRGSG